MKAWLSLFLLLGGCAATGNSNPVSSPALVDHDVGGIPGSWRGADGFTLSAMTADAKGALTFAAARGCSIAQGVLRPLGNERFRVELYPGEGWSREGCGTNRAGSAVAPFTGVEVRLQRQGTTLLVSGDGVRRRLERDRTSDLSVRGEHLLGRWLLANRGQPLPAAQGASLTLGNHGYTLASACGSTTGNGFHTASGLVLRLGGNLYQRTPAECQVRTRGDRLAKAGEIAEWRYLPGKDRLEARLGRERFEFVRG